MGRGAAGRLLVMAAVALAFAVVVNAARAAMTSSREPATEATNRDDGGDLSDADALLDGDDVGDDVTDDVTDGLDEDTVAVGDDPTLTDGAVDEITDEEIPEDTVETTLPPEPVDGTVLVVGGSSLAGLDWNPTTKRALQGAEFTLDLESCRRLYLESCAALRSSAPTTAYEVVTEKGPGHEKLIVFGGYNDSGRRFQEGFIKVVEAARAAGIEQIIWANYRHDPDYEKPKDLMKVNTYRANNWILDDLMATGDYPDVVIADWKNYSLDQSHWFSDNVHFTALGSWAAADYLSRKLAYLDDRACPQPRRAAEKRQNPCPDPDRKPPDVDFQSVYNLKPGRLVCYDVKEKPAHIECKPPSKVDEADTKDAVLETLEYGMDGQQVSNLQVALRKQGFYTGDPSGEYDRETLIGVMRFQIKRGLPVTGSAGPRTRDRLGFGCPDAQRDSDGKCPVGDLTVTFLPGLEKGDKGALVWVLQNRLKELDYLSAKPNSVFGTNTRAAVKKFQADQGLDETGVVDERTAKALGFDVP